MDVTTAISIAISIAAFVLSSIALWQTHFAKFKVICSTGNLQFKIYPFQHNKERWYIPSVDIPITITNVGARAGKILGLRIRINYIDVQVPKNYEFFNPQWDVDYRIYNPISDKRFEWFDKAIIGEWMPFTVLPKQTVTKHLIFESRWDKPIIQENINFELEVYISSTRKWKKVAKWQGYLTSEVWSETIDSMASFIIREASSDAIDLEDRPNLTDLHNQIRGEYLILKGDSDKTSSYFGSSSKKTKNRKKS
ncbi:MAG: hypothetical protein H7Y59_19815 [Anaerolineales bacterium]|nr:hypothetical protein [Anaerolineales bacterium]